MNYKLNLSNITAICIDGTEKGDRQKNLCNLIYTIKNIIKFHSIKYLSYTDLNCKNICEEYKIKKLSNLAEYSEFILSDLNNYVNTDYCMILHDDGFPININLWEKKFLEYDYIGAPWGIETGIYPENYERGQIQGGNGGFSIRSKKMLKLCDFLYKLDKNNIQTRVRNNSFHEDSYICFELRNYAKNNNIDIKFAPYEIAKRFSLETDLKDSPNSIDNVFGFHGKRHITHEQAIDKLRKN